MITNFQLQTTVQIYIGKGDGTFKAPSTVNISADTYSLPGLADFNGDGRIDLAFLTEDSSSQAGLAIALGNGDGTFANATISNLEGGDAIRGGGLVAADFDGDGKIDLALLAPYSFSGIFYGKGDAPSHRYPRVVTSSPKTSSTWPPARLPLRSISTRTASPISLLEMCC